MGQKISAGLVEAFTRKFIEAGNGNLEVYDEDLTYEHEDYGQVAVYRLREGIERFLVTDVNDPTSGSAAQSRIGYFYDVAAPRAERFNHAPSGGNVLFLDGHTEFRRYPGDWPYSRAWTLFVESSGL